MNSVTLSGYVLDKEIYRKSKEDDKYEYFFLLYCYEPFTKTHSKIPIRTSGTLATECYTNLTKNCYVEINGGLVKKDDGTFYVQAKDLVFRRPKGKRTYQYTSTEFIETFAPSKLIERLVNGEDEKKK